MRISYHFLKKITLLERKKLKAFLGYLSKKEGYIIESLNIIFCSDDYLLQINNTHLKHNYYTDIITFDLSETPKCIIGEIYISVDRVKENSVLLAQTLTTELHRVVFHGLLHLCGYKDKKPTDKAQMTAKENYYLKKYLS